MHLPPTSHRVAEHTPDHVNEAIALETQISILYYRTHPQEIQQRLRELDEEWDIERALEANAGLLVVTGSALGFLVHRRFFALPLMVGSFLFQHALQGWCPPVSLLRRKGYRTMTEIEQERDSLKRILVNL